MAAKFTISRLGPLLKEAGNEWMEDKAMKMSAALAYYTAVSIAPLMIITIKLIGIFYRKHAGDLLTAQLAELSNQKVADALTEAIHKAGRPGAGTWATTISIIIALVSASGVFGELQDSLNTIWEVRPKPNRGIMGVVQDRFLSMTMVFGIAFLLLVSMFISTVVHGVSASTVHLLIGGNGKTGQDVLDVVNVIFSLVVVTILFAAIFRFLPDVQIGWSDVWLGAFVTAILFEVGKLGLAEYFVKGSPTSAYGAAGSMVAVLLWVCYSAYILFFGAEFTQVYANEYGSHIVPAENAEPLTEEMRARVGIPHDAGSGSAPGAPAGVRYTAPPALSAVRYAAPRAAAGRMVRNRQRAVSSWKGERYSYVARYVPIVVAVVIARFAWLRFQAARPAPKPAGAQWTKRGVKLLKTSAKATLPLLAQIKKYIGAGRKRARKMSAHLR